MNHPVAEPKPVGRYHPDPEINEGVAADAREGEAASLAVGLAPSPWECECGAAHARGPIEGGDLHRCMNCGYVGIGGRLMDPSGFVLYRERIASGWRPGNPDQVNHVS